MSAAARFCDQCGTPIGIATAVDASSPTRKVVTVLFADLAGSTSFGERVDAESTRDAMAEFHSMVQDTIDDAGGTVAKFIGDGVMALFGVPETAEDDADRAVGAGLRLQQAFVPIREHVRRRHAVDLGLRVGINTGEIVLADGDADLVGDAINTAARLEAACTPGQVLVGEDTWRLTRSHVRYEVLGEVAVKGKHEPVPTFRVADDEVHDGEVHDDDAATPFVGRMEELARLREAFDTAVGLRSARLATVIGAPGVGKTRVAREFAQSLGGAAVVVELRCEPAGTATFAPIADLLRSITTIDDESDTEQVRSALRDLVAELEDADRVAQLLAGFLGAAPARSTEEAFLAVRRLVEATGRQQPLVVVVDDIQWAEPLFLDLMEHLADWVHDAPAMLVGLARPELREVRPSLTEENRTLTMTIGLEGLDARATSELAARLVGAETLPSELVARLPESTEGNPLFVRELMRMLVDDGVIVETADGWQLTIDVEAVEVPPTIQSLLAARLDRMPADERRLVELASVVGPEFALGAVGAISEFGAADLRVTVDRLRRRELVESTGMYWGDDPVYRFHHVLIRDAAYRRLLKRTRADLHFRIGEWTEQVAAGLPGEHEVAIAHHFEQAHEYHRQLDDVSESMVAIGQKAAELLGVAAERSLERDDLPAASALAERALARLGEGDPMIPPLLVVAAEALLGLGDVARGRTVVERLAGLAADDERLGPWAESFVAQLTMLTEPDHLHAAEEQADRAASRLAELGDEAGVAKARLVRASALARLGQVGRCESELDEALTAARSAGDRRRVAAVLGAAPLAALWGPSPIPRAGGRCLDVIRLLRITTGSPSVEATSVRCQAVLEALRGRFDTARTMLTEARATVEELGLRHALNETDLYTGIVELLAGDAAAAEGPLRAAYQGLGRMGIGADAGQAAAYLARAELQLGRIEEAEALALESAELAGENPQTAIAARTARAEILAAQGRFDEAVIAAGDAVARAEGTDIIVDHAAASAVLARLAELAGDGATAERAARTSADLYEQKAATVAATVAVPNQTAVPAQPRSPHPATADENRASRLAQEWLPLWISDEDAHFGRMADEVVAVDHRSVVRTELRGRDRVRAAFGGVDPTGSASLHTETLAVRGDDLVVTSNLLMWALGRDGPVVQTLSVLRWTDDDRVDVNLCFDVDDLDGAIAALERLHRDGHDARREPRNEADRLARRFIEAFTAGAREEWLPMLAPGQLTIDRRPLGVDTSGADEVAVAYPRDRDTGALASEVETIAVRGETFALIHWKAASTHDREWEGFHLTRWTDVGLNDLNVIFPPDQLDEALAELDRRYRADLGDSVEELHASHDPHRPRNEADRLMREFIARFTDGPAGLWTELVATDVVFDDRTPVVGHDPVGKDDLIALWPRDFEPGDMVAAVETIDTRGDSLALTRWVATANNDEAAEWDTTWVTRWNSAGQADLLVRFSSGQVDEAAAELERLCRDAPGDDTRAVSVMRAVISALGDHSFVRRRAEFVADGYAHTDHRSIVGHGTYDFDELVALLSTAGQASLELEPIAVRGDRQVLWQGVTTYESGGESAYLGIAEVDEVGRLTRTIFYDSDDDRARAELDRLWYTSLTPRQRDVSRLAVALGEAWVVPSTHPFDELLATGFEFVDGRTLGMGSLDRAGFEAALRGREADGAMGVPVPSRVEFVSDDVMVFRANNLGHAPDSGVDWEEIACNVLVVEGERIAHLEMFDEDHWDQAIACAEAIARPGVPVRGRSTPTANSASRTLDEAVDRMNAGDSAAEVIADDFQRDDRRRHLAFPEHGADQLRKLLDANTQLGAQHAIDHLAVRGERFVLSNLSTSFDGGHGVVEMLVLSEFDETGRLLVETNFETGRLDEALAELDERWMATLEPADAATRRTVIRFSRSFGAFDMDEFDALLADDFEWADHRAIGYGVLDREAVIEGNRDRQGVMGDHARLTSVVHLIRNGVSVTSGEVRGITPDAGSEWSEEFPTVWVEEGGRLRRLESFELDQLDEALARAEQLIVDRDPGRRLDNLARREEGSAPLSNAMVAWVRRTLTGDRRITAQLDDFAPDFVRTDRRSAVSAGPAGRSEFLASLWTQAEMGSRYGARTLAVRGARLALFELTVDANDSVIEMLLVGELDDERRLRGFVYFDRNALAAAQDELDRRYLAMLTDEQAETLEPGLRFRSAMSSTGTAEMSDVLAQGFVAVDHRAMAFPKLDRDGFLEINQQRDELFGEALVFTTEIHCIEGDVIVASNRMAGLTPDSGIEWLHEFVNIFIVRDGELHGLENFGPDDLDTAMARADELVAARSRSRRSIPQVQRLGQDVVDATTSGDFDAVRACFEEDFVRIDRRRVIGLPDMDRDEYVADLQRQWRLGWRDYRTVAVQAVRPNGFVALFTTDFDDGSESPFGALLIEGATGRIGRLVLYDSDDMQSAFDELDDAWLATLGPTDARTYRAARDQYFAYVGLDRGRFEELTAPGLVFTDHRRLGNFGQLDRAGFVELFAARRDTLGPGAAQLTAVHLVDRGVVVFSKEEHTRSAQYGAETTNTGVHVVRVTEGAVDLGEIYDDADLSAAVTRAELLADDRALGSRRLLENDATRWADRVVAHDGLADVDDLAEDFAREDRRSTVADEPADREQFVETLRAQRELGAVWSNEVVAIRGDRFGLFRLTARHGDSLVEFLTVLEVEETGRALRMSHFDGDDVSAAMEYLSRSWAATLPDDVLPVLRLAAEYERVGYTAGLDGGSFFADDVVIVDHRSVGLGESDLSGYLRLHGQRADDGPVTGFAPDVVPVSPNVLLFSNVNTIEAGDGASWEEFYFQLFVARNGKIARLELFAEDQRDAAFQRAQELAES